MWVREIMASERLVVFLDSMFALLCKEMAGPSLPTPGDINPLSMSNRGDERYIYDTLSGSL